MPRAEGMKFHYLDHDTDERNLVPPVQNQWYTIFDALDVRLLWCIVFQSNDELVAKDLEVRWTIDGNVYITAPTAEHNTTIWVYRDHTPSIGGLVTTTEEFLAAKYTSKRGQSFKVEVRITSALGTNQVLLVRCVRETLELT